MTEDIVVILFFYAIFSILQIIVPVFLQALCIENDKFVQIFVWLLVTIVTAIILKSLQDERNQECEE